MPLEEKQAFVPDGDGVTTAGDKTDVLIKALNGRFHDRDIVLIERIEIAAKGWRITWRPS